MGAFEGKRVTVMGLGRFGGGAEVTRWLVAQGAEVLVTDLQPAEKLGEQVAGVQGLVDSGAVRLRLGEHNVSDFTTCDLVVANPAVPRPWDNRFLRASAAANVPITTEIRLLIERLPSRRTIGITGSAGKSTTSALIHHILATNGVAAVLGGNIGGSLLGSLDQLDEKTWVVLELSSAMLHWLGEVPWSPRVAVVTNVSPNHVDWHGSFDHYEASKRRLVARQGEGDVAVLGPTLQGWGLPTGVRRVVVSGTMQGLSIPGAHNGLNAAMAVEACLATGAGLTRSQAEVAARTFGGLPHRLQLAAEVGGVRYYNDSKATTPESCLLAVAAFGEGSAARIHLIAGGYDKEIDLGAIAALAGRIGGLYTIGVTGPAIAAASLGKAEECGTLAGAVERVQRRVKKGDIVLLSPGCASWDQFENYEQRGEVFCGLVRAGMQREVLA